MSRKKTGREKGKGLAISGIPLSGGSTQIEETSVEANRDEAANAFKEDQDDTDMRDYAHRDYIGDETDRMGAAGEGFIANKDDEEWSDGLEDEANPTEDFSDQALYPEIQPLHIDPASVASGEEDDADMILRPDTDDNESDDFTDVELATGNKKGVTKLPEKRKNKRSA